MSIFLVVFANILTANSSPRSAKCIIIQNGEVLVDGSCAFDQMYSDGYFMVTGQNGIFAYAGGNPKGAPGWTNYYKGVREKNADTSLGTLIQKGACWVNSSGSNKICAWSK